MFHNSSEARHGFHIGQDGAEVEFAAGDCVTLQGRVEAGGEVRGLVERARVGEDVQTDVCLLVELNFPVE